MKSRVGPFKLFRVLFFNQKMSVISPPILSGNWLPLTVGLTEEKGSHFPSPRAGHTLVYDAVLNASILFGGASHEDGLSNDTFLLDHGNDYFYIRFMT